MEKSSDGQNLEILQMGKNVHTVGGNPIGESLEGFPDGLWTHCPRNPLLFHGHLVFIGPPKAQTEGKNPIVRAGQMQSGGSNAFGNIFLNRLI